MTTGWKQVGGKWYYFDLKTGAMRQSAWLSTTNGNWYYFDSNGAMLASTTRKIDGTTYTFDANGRWIA
jgi:glucan-binding YG repeat protein